MISMYLAQSHASGRPPRVVFPGASSSRSANMSESPTCSVCFGNIEGPVITAPCRHTFDAACMEALISASTKDESLFPPKCCLDPIPIESVQSHVEASVVAAFKEKSIEFSTPIRVYCSNPNCSRFLGPKNDGKSPSAPLTCSCTTVTCNSCRGTIANGDIRSHTCTSDTLEQEVRALADKKKWATCPGCNNLVELSVGCSHMTCRCGTQFCYRCNAEWGACDCARRELLAMGHAPLPRDRIFDYLPIFAQPLDRHPPARAPPVMRGNAPLTRHNLERLGGIDHSRPLPPHLPTPFHRLRRLSTQAEAGPDRHNNMFIPHSRPDFGSMRAHIESGMSNPPPIHNSPALPLDQMFPDTDHTSRPPNYESLSRDMPSENPSTLRLPRPLRPDILSRPMLLRASRPDRMQGAGTRTSPIVLDDDGDTVMGAPAPAIPPFLHNTNRSSIPPPRGIGPFRHAIRADGPDLNVNVDENPFATNVRPPWEEPLMSLSPLRGRGSVRHAPPPAVAASAGNLYDRQPPFMEPHTVVQPPDANILYHTNSSINFPDI
ncbi:uncharacterized protein BT62DRAFT_725362 [Guyanagaster necrorhizus]|uniref:RBR-type E3 ubiquitin transferase n=1 Tax=Guyanagaster necrorhizus TaxID=856835 RepID=A0A9P8AV46_9AGAR|nr:uncharacterized protein BT62DRAFT_725362 [Guyanagaster necrorhizus MCA 3950]KAG7448746.1 hypothetical protein BT62DRAFT_725362 [Guyanagaster necrorhizus MCA 3950]